MPKMYKWRVVGKVEINPITDHNDLGHDDINNHLSKDIQDLDIWFDVDDISDAKVIETIHDKEKNNG